jgi:hypothetical protein
LDVASQEWPFSFRPGSNPGWPSHLPVGLASYGLAGRLSLQANHNACSQSASVAFKKVVMHARATLAGGALSLPINTGWTCTDIHIGDPVEVALTGRLQMSALEQAAGSTSRAYVGLWNAFVLWCGSLMRSRRPLPADDLTVALYFQSHMDSANSFSTIKSASVSIAFFHKISLFTNHPSMVPEVCIVRTAAARKFSLSVKRVKEPFLWFQLVDFAALYGNQN